MDNLFEWDNVLDGTLFDDLNANHDVVKAVNDYIEGKTNDELIPVAYNTYKLAKLIVFDIVKEAELASLDLAKSAENKGSLRYSLDDFVNKYKNQLYLTKKENKPSIDIPTLREWLSVLNDQGLSFSVSQDPVILTVSWKYDEGPRLET
ncbi:hypothetical protein [Ligilactobacillus salivarius]|uniref:hypothetical protein n=1 Tax=Ligilactobacillus salivarius TaxID=1624 RepID=UPI0009DA3767|nr:hypothetical protein [Ligilactobacillus salivarius]OQR18778.1 hypothetical protein B6U39_09220 [Ligilactobacillus salivarius]